MMAKKYEITSGQNATMKMFKTLLTSAGITEQEQAFIFGRKAVHETSQKHRDHIIGAVISSEHDDQRLRDFENLYVLKPSLFDELDVFGSHAPILLVKPPAIAPWKPEESPGGCHLYLPFQDPGNIGTAIRSATGFGVSEIILGPGAAHPFHPKSSRAASGALFANKFARVAKPEELDQSGIPVIALDLRGDDISKFTFPGNFVLVPGVEGQGLDEKFKADFRVNIPISSSLESLNGAVATGIALYAWAVSKPKN